MLAEPFLEIRPLHIVKAARIAAVMPREQPALGIDLDAESVAAAFSEDFIAPALGMITPDELTQRVHRRLIDNGTDDIAADGAALRRVQPAVGPPLQAVGT